jgi:FkbM family methyltransferase
MSATSKLRTTTNIIKLLTNWPWYFADHLHLIRSGNIIYRLRNGMRLETRVGSYDKNIIYELVVKNVYMPAGFEIMNNDIVVDIGAHIGIFSVLAAVRAKQGKVYSIEPMPENYSLLLANIKQNNLKNVTPVNKALSSDIGEKHLFISSSSGGHSFVFLDKKITNIAVQTSTLETIIKEYDIHKIDFLKIDCEGAEYEILFNCPKEVLNKIRKISMECHDIDDKKNSNSLKLFLEANGFEVKIDTSSCLMLYAKNLIL